MQRRTGDIVNAMTTGSAIRINVVEIRHTIPPTKISKAMWKRPSKDLQRHSKESVEQHLGIQTFHDRLHEMNTPHWIERRVDGVYLLWGEHAQNCALMPGWSMEMPTGTRIQG